MSIPANIKSELTALQAQLAAATPLSSASGPAIVALQLNTAQFLSDANTALTNAAGVLDTWNATTDPAAIVTGFLGLVVNSEDQNTLCNIAGYVGRADTNIDQLV